MVYQHEAALAALQAELKTAQLGEGTSRSQAAQVEKRLKAVERKSRHRKKKLRAARQDLETLLVDVERTTEAFEAYRAKCEERIGQLHSSLMDILFRKELELEKSRAFQDGERSARMIELERAKLEWQREWERLSIHEQVARRRGEEVANAALMQIMETMEPEDSSV